ncbi:MAG: hypothetical protein M1114_05375 [Candidatus Dependentiae bacterium]|nr:hypothetical protein [Candidatus Dependentiae bacterium]
MFLLKKIISLCFLLCIAGNRIAACDDSRSLTIQQYNQPEEARLNHNNQNAPQAQIQPKQAHRHNPPALIALNRARSHINTQEARQELMESDVVRKLF